MLITILGQTPAQKNKKKMARIGNRNILYTEKSVKEWQESAALQLGQHEPFEERVRITYMFYVKDNRRRDLDNMEASVNDALVKAGIIKDDSWQFMRTGGADARIDKINPRAVIAINIDDSVGR